MIVVSGATGQLGSRIVDRLLERVPADTLGVSVRDVDRAAHLSDRGVRVRAGDFTDPASLGPAFEGATTVLVVSAAIRGADAAAANKAAVDAACAAGVERILYTSHQAAAYDSLFSPQITHAETEDHLAGLGVRFAVLRNGFYASTLGFYIGDAIVTGRLVAPEDGPVSWTAHADLAEAAAVALVSEGAVEGVSAPLTGPEALDFEAVTGILGDLSGRAVTRVVVADDEWKAAAVKRGMPAPAADFALGMFRAARRGEFAVTDPTLESLIGHRTTSVRTVLKAMLSQR